MMSLPIFAGKNPTAGKISTNRSAPVIGARRLPLEVKHPFRDWLEANVPDRAARVMSLGRQMRRG
jgi:hypothetical protein